MGFWRTLDGVLGGKTISGSIDAQKQDVLQQQQQQQMQALITKLAGGDAQREFILRTNPKAFTDAVAENYKPQKLGPGEGLIPGGGYGGLGGGGAPPPMGGSPAGPRPIPSSPPNMIYNQKTGIDGGIPYAIGQNGTATFGQGRPASIAETETATHNFATETQAEARMNAQIEQFAKTYGLDVDRLKEAARHNQQTEGIGWKNANRPVGGGGGGRGGGAGGSMGDDSDWEDVN